MKRTLAALLTAVVLAAAPTLAAAEEKAWPSENITAIITHGAGGDTDYNARLICRLVEKKLGVSVVPTNLTGSNGAIAMTEYKDAKPDGSAFVFTTPAALSANEATGLVTYGYDAFEPVCIYGRQAGENVIVPADSPYKTFGDLLQASKDKPNTVRFGISTGGVIYVASVVMTVAGGAQFVPIEQGDAASRLTALLGGHVDATIVPYSVAREYIEAGKVRSLCTLLAETPSMIKNVPPARETLPELQLNTLYVVLAPKGTSPEIIEKFNAAILDVVNNDPEYKEAVESYNFQSPWALNVADTNAELKTQRDIYMSFSKYMQ